MGTRTNIPGKAHSNNHKELTTITLATSETETRYQVVQEAHRGLDALKDRAAILESEGKNPGLTTAQLERAEKQLDATINATPTQDLQALVRAEHNTPAKAPPQQKTSLVGSFINWEMKRMGFNP